MVIIVEADYLFIPYKEIILEVLMVYVKNNIALSYF
jgi:hypothetical protein